MWIFSLQSLSIPALTIGKDEEQIIPIVYADGSIN